MPILIVNLMCRSRYVFLCVPAISRLERHPFTISSPPGSAERTLVSQNGWSLSRCGRSLSVHASGLDTHRDSIASQTAPSFHDQAPHSSD
jgi:hypothetical protein|eukprot:SAG25_NODE_33_length_20262_cov_33.203293_28_plen_90_part_00